jgi:peroxiredoxin
MQNFQTNLSRLEAADTQVLGVSMDSPFANKAFADKLGVKFPLLSDWFNGGATVRAYGAYSDENRAARRVTYLIGKDGKIENVTLGGDAIDPTNIVIACERIKKPA